MFWFLCNDSLVKLVWVFVTQVILWVAVKFDFCSRVWFLWFSFNFIVFMGWFTYKSFNLINWSDHCVEQNFQLVTPEYIFIKWSDYFVGEKMIMYILNEWFVNLSNLLWRKNPLYDIYFVSPVHWALDSFFTNHQQWKATCVYTWPHSHKGP